MILIVSSIVEFCAQPEGSGEAPGSQPLAGFSFESGMPPKPKPIRRIERKGQSIYRNPGKGFVLPRLNEPEEKTEAVGFIDWREYEYDGGTVLRNPTAR